MVSDPGHQRARAGAAARPDRNALPLRPLDEVGDDQEVARIFHAGDDVEFEGKPLLIILRGHSRCETVNLQPSRQALLRLPAQLGSLRACGIRSVGARSHREHRQNGFARHRPEGAALGDLDGRGEGFRNVGKQHRHFRPRLETMVWRQLLAIGLGDEPAAGDTEQRIMRLVIIGGRKIRLVGRDQRQALGIGEIDQPGFDAPLAFDSMALQFDV